MPASTRGTGRNSVLGMVPRSSQRIRGHVLTVSWLQRPKPPVRFRAYSSWVISVATVSRGARRHQSMIGEVSENGAFPTTWKGRDGGRAARKSPSTTRTFGRAPTRACSRSARCSSISYAMTSPVMAASRVVRMPSPAPTSRQSPSGGSRTAARNWRAASGLRR